MAETKDSSSYMSKRIKVIKWSLRDFPAASHTAIISVQISAYMPAMVFCAPANRSIVHRVLSAGRKISSVIIIYSYRCRQRCWIAAFILIDCILALIRANQSSVRSAVLQLLGERCHFFGCSASFIHL